MMLSKRLIVNGLKLLSLLYLPCITNARANTEDSELIRGTTKVKPVTVLQNRYFLKSYRPEIGILAGTMLNEAYTDTRFYGFRAGMFFSEWLGLELQGFSTKVSDTDDKRALNKLKYRPLEDPPAGTNITVSPTPEVNPIRSIKDATAIFAPFYGKLNFMDSFIIYTDLYISMGLAQVTTDQKNHTALTIGAGERFYFSNNWSLRIDFKDRIYNETRAGKDTRKNAYSVDFGLSYFFR